MKPDKKTQKNIAKSLDKLLNKGATKEDFISFAELIIENSQIKSEGTPKVIWDMKESEYSNPDTKFLYGEHFGGIIMMNSAIIPVLQTKREGFLSQTIDMIGHEYNYFEQFQKSYYISTPSSRLTSALSMRKKV